MLLYLQVAALLHCCRDDNFSASSIYHVPRDPLHVTRMNLEDIQCPPICLEVVASPLSAFKEPTFYPAQAI